MSIRICSNGDGNDGDGDDDDDNELASLLESISFPG